MKKNIYFLIDLILCLLFLLIFHITFKSGYGFYLSLAPVFVVALYIFIIPSYRGLTIACALGAFNSIHHLLFPELNSFNEPEVYKSIKDIIYLSIIISVFFKNDKRKYLNYSNMFFWLLPLIMFFFIVLIHGSVSVLNGANWVNIAVDWRYLVAYPVLGILSIGVIDTEEKVKFFFNAMIFVGLIVSIIAVLEIILGIKTHFYGYVSFGPVKQRAISTLQNPNNCALFLFIPLIYLFYSAMKEKISFIGAFSFLIILSSTFLTFSRSIFVLIFVATFLIVISHRSIKSLFFSLPMVVGSIALVLFTTLSRNQVQQLGDSSPGFLYYFGRLFYALQSSESALGGWSGLGWLTGVGFGHGNFVTTDNMYALLFVKGGAISVLVYIVMFVFIFLSLRGNYSVERDFSKSIIGFVIVFLLSTLIHMLSAVTLSLYPFSQIFWVIIGIGLWFSFKKSDVD